MNHHTRRTLAAKAQVDEISAGTPLETQASIILEETVRQR
jgi:hypothetical protein